MRAMDMTSKEAMAISREVANLRWRMRTNPTEAPNIRRQIIERLYVLAIWHARAGSESVAETYAAECIEMLKERGSETVEDCATETIKIGDILIPELLHEEVVKRDLAHYGVKIVKMK